MRYLGISFICAFGLLAASDSAPQGKPDFSGTWRVVADKSQVHAGKPALVNLVVEQKGAAIHVIRTMQAADGKESTVEIACTTDGKDCDAKGFKASFWYDGRALVEMDVSDDLVSKITMTLDDPQAICATVAWISPPDEPEALVFERM